MRTLASGISVDSSKGLFTPSMSDLGRVWEMVLLDLVALQDADTKRFWRTHWYFFHRPNDETLREYRDEIRAFWSGNRGLLGAILSGLVHDATRGYRKPWIVESPSAGLYRITPDYRNFELSLAFAFERYQKRMATCENPDCKDHFLKPRKTQKFCDRPTCLAYGQRKQKRDWWEKHGGEWRQEREVRHRGKTRKSMHKAATVRKTRKA